MCLKSLHWLRLAEDAAGLLGLDLSQAALQGRRSELPALVTCTRSSFRLAG